jgi:hypothetical protein
MVIMKMECLTKMAIDNVNAIAAALKEFQPVMQHFKNLLILINMNNFTKNKEKLILTIFLLLGQLVFSQEKIEADIKTINFLEKSPYKTEMNSLAENLLRILYFQPRAKNNSKVGFLDAKGQIRINPIYDMASDFYDGFANIIKDSTYGYIDKKGTEILFKQYQETYFYYGNTGIAKKDGKYGLINRNGNELSEFKYNMILFFGFNHFKGILSKDSNQILDNNGKIIFNEQTEYNIKSDYFEKDSLLVYEKNVDNKKLQGLVGFDNKIVTEPIYDNIYFIEDKEFFVVEKDKKYGFINKAGLLQIPVMYDEVGFNITDELISVRQKNKWGFINRKNEVKIPFEYDEAKSFFDGLAYVKKDQTYGYIDKNNKIKFSVEKSDFPFYSNDLSIIKKNGKYGYINKKGRIIIPTIYEYAYPFVNNIAYIELNGKSGFINKKGKEIITTKYKQLWLESEGLIRFVE